MISRQVKWIILFLFIGVSVVAFAAIPPSKSSVSNPTLSSTEANESSIPYCNSSGSSAVAVVGLLPQVATLSTFKKAEGNFSNWVLTASSLQKGTESGLNETVTSFHNLEIIFFSVGNRSTDSYCSPSYVQEFLYVYIPIEADGTYNMTAANAYTLPAEHLRTTTSTS